MRCGMLSSMGAALAVAGGLGVGGAALAAAKEDPATGSGPTLAAPASGGWPAARRRSASSAPHQWVWWCRRGG